MLLYFFSGFKFNLGDLFSVYWSQPRKKIKLINEIIAQHEEELANPILDYIDSSKNFNLIGKNKILNKNRAPTISFYSNNKSSEEISKFLVKNKIATRNDNFYAWRCLKALGIDTDDGVVRVSLVHYNKKNEVNKIINILDKIFRWREI